MKRQQTLLNKKMFSTLFGLIVLFCHQLAIASPSNTPTAFVGVNVIPMDGEHIFRDYTVVISGQRITDIGPTGKVVVPATAKLIKAGGKYLMPGLAEMHGHIYVPEGNAHADIVEAMMFLYVANGVTTVRGMFGLPGQQKLKARTNSGELIGPTLYLAAPSLNGNSVNSPEHGAQLVRQYKKDGWDLLKIHPGLTLDEYAAIATTGAEVGIRLAGHIPADVGLRQALAMGQQTVDHLDGYLDYIHAAEGPIDSDQLKQVIALTKGAGAWVVPTMALWDSVALGLGDLNTMRNYPELKYWPSAANFQGMEGADGWAERFRKTVASVQDKKDENAWRHKNRRQLLKALADGGVGILMGTDSPQLFSVPGFSLHREMQVMADSGMTPFQILKSGTTNVGEYFQSHDAFGQVAVGRRADLILTNSNPLQNVANVADRAGVMVRGQWLPESVIQKRLAQISKQFGH